MDIKRIREYGDDIERIAYEIDHHIRQGVNEFTLSGIPEKCWIAAQIILIRQKMGDRVWYKYASDTTDNATDD